MVLNVDRGLNQCHSRNISPQVAVLLFLSFKEPIVGAKDQVSRNLHSQPQVHKLILLRVGGETYQKQPHRRLTELERLFFTKIPTAKIRNYWS